MTSKQDQMERVEIGGVIFYAHQELASRLVQLVEAAQNSVAKHIDKQQWAEITAELLLERLQKVSSRNELTSDDLEYLDQYLSGQFGTDMAVSCGRGKVAGIMHPLMLVCTFLL